MSHFHRHLGLPIVLACSLALAGCTPWFPTPASSPTTGSPGVGTGSPSASSPPTAAPSAPATDTATPPPDDTTAAPQPGDQVISSRISYGWGWPGPGQPATVGHDNAVPVAPPPNPPLPFLTSIGAGAHPLVTPPYDQLSFRFEGGFPGYELEYVPSLTGDASGLPIPMEGTDSILRVVFRLAQAHTEDGTSSVLQAPPTAVGLSAITRYAPAGDFEGTVTYGIGVGHPVPSTVNTAVRVFEVERIEQGRHLYVVAVQVDASPWR
jgi:hypothetical protein